MNNKFIFIIIYIILKFSIKTLNAQSYVPVVFFVSDFVTNKPLNGAQVSIRQAGWATKSTGTDGKISFDNVPEGAINFTITKDGYRFYEGEENLSSEVKTNTFRYTLTPILETKDKILITGEITDIDGRDIEGALVEVKVANIIQYGVSDKSGNYLIEITLNTEYPVSSLTIETKKGSCKVKQNANIPRGNIVSQDINLDCKDKPLPQSSKNEKVLSTNELFSELEKELAKGKKLLDEAIYKKSLTSSHLEWGENVKTIIKILDPEGEIYEESSLVGLFYDGWNIATFKWTKIEGKEQKKRNVQGFAQSYGTLKAIIKFSTYPNFNTNSINELFSELEKEVFIGDSLMKSINSKSGLSKKHHEWLAYVRTIIYKIDPYGKIYDESTPVGMFYDGWNIATFYWENIDETESKNRNIEGFGQALGALRAIVKFKPSPRIKNKD